MLFLGHNRVLQVQESFFIFQLNPEFVFASDKVGGEGDKVEGTSCVLFEVPKVLLEC